MDTLRLKEVEDELATLDREIAKLRAQLQPLEDRREKVRSLIEMMKDYVSSRFVSDRTVNVDRAKINGQPKKTIAEYAMLALEASKEWLDTRTLISVMEEIGFRSQARNLYTNVFGTLNREVERKDTKFTKKNGKWGLRDWLEDDHMEEAL
jgi:hypothetical protein